MQLEFFPSRSLTLYLAKLFIVRFAAVLIMLVMILMVLDLLGESGKILAYPGNGQAELWQYVSMRVPQLVSRFLPYSVLLATIITLVTLNQNSEVVAMKASGLSAHQVLAPFFATTLIIALLHFGFNERVVTRSSATLKAWSAAEFGPIPKNTDGKTNVYLSYGSSILIAASVEGRGDQTVMNGVTWYERDADNVIVKEVRSARATFAKPGWRLDNPKIFDTASLALTIPPSLVVASKLVPEQVVLGSVNADSQNIFELAESIKELKAAGRRTTELEGAWWHKISSPLSSVLMPLLGAVAAFGLARSGQLMVRALLGISLGFAYFVVDNAALAMGNFGAYSPMVAAWGPFLLFALIGETILVRTEE